MKKAGVSLVSSVVPWAVLLLCAAVGNAAAEPAGEGARHYDREPVAYAGPDAIAVVGEAVEFYGAGASPDDEITAYAWDFDSDGLTDSSSAAAGHTTHTFDEPGDYQCVLTVTDSAGRTARSVRRIIVVAQEAERSQAADMLGAPKPLTANPPDGVTHRYAVMVNGGYEDRFWTDVLLCYAMLTDGYGFSPADIYLLNYNGSNPLGENPNGMIDYSASLANLQTVFTQLAAISDADDEVFLWITDHGRGYDGPLSQGGQYLGYMDGRASVDPGDEPDFPESSFKLRSIFTGGDYRCNHGMNVWKVRREYVTATKTQFYRNKYVSQLTDVYIESLGTTVTDTDIYIERLKDYLLGDTNGDGYIDTSLGEVFDYDGDGNQPYNHATGQFDEDDWGPINNLEDNYNSTGGGLPVNAYPVKLFDQDFEGKICIDLAYAGGVPNVDGRDEDNAGLFDWMDANQDGDTDDIVSVDEAACVYSGEVYDDDFRDLLSQLQVARITIAAEPCFSGGLVEDLSAADRVICTATIEDAVSWGNTFIRGFVAALHKQDQYGSPVNADTDENGYISMREAFNYAASIDYNDEIPQYDDNGDGISHTDPIPSGGDGDFGGQTYLCDYVALLDHFEWDTISSPQSAGTPFVCTIVARDSVGTVVETYEGTVAITGRCGGSGEQTIGTGTSTWSYPMSTYYHDARTQVIYLASELGGAGVIRSLALDVSTLPGQTMNNWTIRIKHTPLSSYTSPAWEASGWTTVYQTNQTVSTTGWVTFAFSTPFQYDGASNLMIDFSFNNDSYTTDGLCRYSSPGGNRSIYYRTDSAYGDPLTWSGTVPTPNVSTRVPNIKIEVGRDVAVTPATSGSFVNGVWTGPVTVEECGLGVTLLADDLSGHTGLSNVFDVIASIVDAKSLADGAAVEIAGALVSAAFDGFFYVQDDSRCSGIRVEKPGYAAVVGSYVVISGVVTTTADGERCIAATSITPNP